MHTSVVKDIAFKLAIFNLAGAPNHFILKESPSLASTRISFHCVCKKTFLACFLASCENCQCISKFACHVMMYLSFFSGYFIQISVGGIENKSKHSGKVPWGKENLKC